MRSEYQSCLDVLRARHQPACDTIRVRREFLSRSQPTDPKPPMACLMSPHGESLRLELILLFLAQNGCGPVFDLPVSDLKLPEGKKGGLTWSSLLMDTSASSQQGTIPPNDALAARTRRAGRKAQSAISVLSGQADPKENQRKAQPHVLLEMTREHNRVHVTLCDEKPRAGRPLTWAAPPQDDYQSLEIPDTFFTQGWIYALNNAEIALYLMYRLECQTSSRSNPPSSAWLTPILIKGNYGLSPSVAENLPLLRMCGIIQSHRGWERRNDGTVPWPDRDSTSGRESKRDDLLNDKILMMDAGLDQDALTTLGRALRGEIPSTTGILQPFLGI